MSAQFNNATTAEEINLDENIKTDSTLKWRGLQQNNFASKGNNGVKSVAARQSKAQVATIEPELATKAEVDEPAQGGTDSKAEKARLVVEDGQIEATPETTSKIEGTEPAMVVEAPAPETAKVEEPMQEEKPPEEKRRKATKTPNITKSDRNLRSKATEAETSQEATEVSQEDAADVESKRGRKRKGDEPPAETLLPSDSAEKKKGRQRKVTDLPKPTEDPQPTVEEPVKVEETPVITPEKSETESSPDKPRLIMTIRKDKAATVVPEPDPIAVTVEKTAKKRGRKPKSEMTPKNDTSPIKKSPRLSRDGSESILASAIARKEKQNDGPPTRLSRRIKPTAKILASEELRQEFEYQHLSRLHASEEHLENVGRPAAKEEAGTSDLIGVGVCDKQDVKPADLEQIVAKPLTLEDQIPISIIPNHQVAAKTANKAQTSSPSTPPSKTVSFVAPSTATVSNSSPKPSPLLAASPILPRHTPKVPCPDPEQFLHDIKNSKLNFHRSPEDNKKLNKKQQKRLLKLKEKHFNMLGLRKTPKATAGGANDGRSATDQTNSDDSESDDNEEFVPSKKVVTVGRPNVTLRSLRQPKHMLADKEKVVSDIPQRGRRPVKDKPEKALPIVTSIHNFPSPSSSGVTRLPSKSYSTPPGSGSSGSSTAVTTPVPIMSTPPRLEKFLCTCADMTKYFVRRADTSSYCVAIDEIDGQKIGCCNELTGELLNLRRPSVKASYMILCRSHEKRLLAHNCCAGCGVFLTKGVFMLCSNKHFFHRNCATKFIYNAPYDPNSREFMVPQLVLKCPHCGADAPVKEISITFKCGGKPPVFSPSRDVNKPAKMGTAVYNGHSRNFTKPSPCINIEKLVPSNILEILQQATVRLKSQAPKIFDARDFFYAIRNGDDVHRLAEIIVSGFDVTTPLKEFHNETCLHLISNFGTLTMAYMCLSRVPSTGYLNFMDNELRTAVMCAVVGGKNDILQLLVYAGADPTLRGPDGMTALHLAAKIGNLAATQIMLDFYRQSVAISKLAVFVNSLDDGRWSALVWAAENGHTDIVSYLLSLDADVTLCDTENNTVLHWAVLSGKLETLLPLLRRNVNINGQNINGDTPLHIACRQANTQLCVLLLANGASRNIKNISNEMPINCVLDTSSECYRVLQLNYKLGGLGAINEKKIYNHDISNGREQHPIQIVGTSPDESIILPDFRYITKNILLQNNIQIDQRISQMRVCTCSDNCITDSCQCGQISIQNWYTLEGRLIEEFNFQDPPMIFECSECCCCSKLLCKNRVVQNGTRFHFQVFECDTKGKGFGVKCLTKITKGSFVAEYTGEILTDVEADRRTDDSYFFDLGASEHCIDANLYGNVSRFFNHSCSPNIVPIRVYYDHQDLRFPKIAFFASRDIDVGEEIAFDYGVKFWMVKHKSFTCYCMQESCRYSKDTIKHTLDEYNQRSHGSQH